MEKETVELLSDEVNSGSDEEKTSPRKDKKRKKATRMPSMRKAKKSKVWEHFDEKKDEEGNIKGHCKYCPKKYCADPNLNGTTAMKKHIPKCPENPANKKHQTNIFVSKNDDGVGGNVKTWKYDYDVSRKALVKMIILDEQPFSVVQKRGFIRYSQSLCPSFNLPSRFTASRDCMERFLEEKSKLKSFFKKNTSRISFTTDTWTSIKKVNFMCVTAHYIDEKWCLHKKIISFKQILSHKGEDIGRELLDCFDDWGIKNVMTITLDNVASNTSAMSYIKPRLNNLIGNGDYIHMRCMAHILNIIVREGLDEYTPHIDRIRCAIKYLRISPARLESFKACVLELGIKSKAMLSLDCPTRWNSTFDMLQRAEKLEEAFGLYERRHVIYKHDLGNDIPTRTDWHYARKFTSILEFFKRKTQNVSGSSYVLANNFFHEVMDIDAKLRSLMSDKEVEFQFMAGVMKEKFDKYWSGPEVDETETIETETMPKKTKPIKKKLNMVMYFATILDPCCKLQILRYGFKKVYDKEKKPNVDEAMAKKHVEGMVKEIDDALKLVFIEYEEKFGVPNSDITSQGQTSNQISSHGDPGFLDDYAVASDSTKSSEIQTELDKYITEQREPMNAQNFDTLLWWKLHSPRFPTVSIMARDILSIPITSVASECAFSAGGRVLDSFRSSLSNPMIEALICTQDWIRTSDMEINFDDDLEIHDNLGKELFEKNQMIQG